MIYTYLCRALYISSLTQNENLSECMRFPQQTEILKHAFLSGQCSSYYASRNQTFCTSEEFKKRFYLDWTGELYNLMLPREYKKEIKLILQMRSLLSICMAEDTLVVF